jgi:hypothetical protein
MSSNRRGHTPWRDSVLAAALALGLLPLSVRALEMSETAVPFSLASDGLALEGSMGSLGGVAGASQLVLELGVRVPACPANQAVLLELRVLCGSGGQAVELLSSMDLFPVGAEGQTRLAVFDLTPLLHLEAPPCPLAEAVLQLSPVDENLEISLDPEVGDGKVQVTWY